MDVREALRTLKAETDKMLPGIDAKALRQFGDKKSSLTA
jgi:hypothetical protein